MKKLFVYALAVGMFTACSQDETIEMQSPMQISFEGAYVENATRSIDPSFHNEKKPLTEFDVWAFMDNTTGMVFEDEDVTKVNGDWTYTNIQYWTPGHTYYFAALAPMNSDNIGYGKTGAGDLGLGNIEFTNVDGTEDLLYAATTKTTPAEIISDPGKVEFQFGHLLSKVKFSFTNGFDNDNAFIKVKNIRMTAPSKAQINLNQKDWWSSNAEGKGWALTKTEEDITLLFGDMKSDEKEEAPAVGRNESAASLYERLTFPATGSRKYVVTFDVELYMSNVLAYENTLRTTIEGAELFMGKAYNFHAEINENNIAGSDKLYPIKFEAEVTDWVSGNGYEGGQIGTVVVGQ